MTRRVFHATAALAIGLTSCGNPDPPVEWTGEVEQDIDNLTGEPTGYYTTWGPSVRVSVHGRPTTVSAGYYCMQAGSDGLAVRMAVPLDSVRLRREFSAAAANTRLAVDRVPIDWNFNHYFTDSTAAVLASPVLASMPATPSLNELQTQGRTAYIGWEPYRDQVMELVANADSMGFDLGDIGSTVVRFPVGNIATAIEAVRFWCPAHEMVDSLNVARNRLLALADSIRARQQAREAARFEEAERREAARREEAERRDLQLAFLRGLRPAVPEHRARAILAYAESHGVEVLNQPGLERVCNIWRGRDRSDRSVGPITSVAMRQAC